MICARCDQPIRPRQKYETRDVERASGPSVTVYFHARHCEATPRQTTQDDRPWQRR